MTTSLSNSGRETSLSVSGESVPTCTSASPFHHTKKSYRYRKIGGGSSIDETLFTSEREQHLRSLNSSSKRRLKSAGVSEEWILHEEQNHIQNEKKKQTACNTPPIKSPLTKVGIAPRTRSRMYKSSATSSYVDESLFGPRLHSPSFAAPWEKPEDRKRPLLTWSPPVVGSLCYTPRSTPSSRPLSGSGSRPGSAKGTRQGSATGAGDRRNERSSTPSKKPPWK